MGVRRKRNPRPRHPEQLLMLLEYHAFRRSVSLHTCRAFPVEDGPLNIHDGLD